MHLMVRDGVLADGQGLCKAGIARRVAVWRVGLIPRDPFGWVRRQREQGGACGKLWLSDSSCE